MAKIYVGDEVLIKLDCKENVDSQPDLWINYKKPISESIERWQATGVGNYAEYTTVKDVDLDEVGTWELQPWSDTFDVHGDIVEMGVFLPLVPFKEGSQSAYLEGVEA